MSQQEKSISVFDENAREYDDWFDEFPAIHQSELLALKRFVPPGGFGLDVGAGTGRFTAALGVKLGIEPAKEMREIARARGIEVLEGRAEALPFSSESFDFVLFVTSLCFIRDPEKALQEAFRVLKKGGEVVAGIIAKDSLLGRKYAASGSKFFRDAHFISPERLQAWMNQTGFRETRCCQTLRGYPLKVPEDPIEGAGEGSFVVVAGKKPGAAADQPMARSTNMAMNSRKR